MFWHKPNEAESKHDDDDESKHDDDDEEEQIEIEYKCEDCNFVATDEISLELHNERKHTGFFECVFCEYTADDEKDLNMHLHTCETYTCGECEPKFLAKNIHDLKAHLIRKHADNSKNTDINKLDRSNIDKESRRTENSEYFN